MRGNAGSAKSSQLINKEEPIFSMTKKNIQISNSKNETF